MGEFALRTCLNEHVNNLNDFRILGLSETDDKWPKVDADAKIKPEKDKLGKPTLDEELKESDEESSESEEEDNTDDQKIKRPKDKVGFRDRKVTIVLNH